jgi:Ca-activated chloride channel homolog
MLQTYVTRSKYIGVDCATQMFWLAALTISICSGARVHGQSPTASYRSVPSTNVIAYPSLTYRQDEMITIRSKVDEVRLLLTAKDKRGRVVQTLTRTDFSILDDHKPPQAILSFHHEVDLPLHLGLLVDVSRSVDSRFELEEDAASDFLRGTIRPGGDRAFIVGFNSQSQLVEGFTGNLQRLQIAIHRLQNGGGTALYDAVYRACSEQLLNDDSEPPARKTIVIVSDGEDNQSEGSLGNAIAMAQRAEVTIYAISTNDSGVVTRGDRVLAQLAGATGGRAFFFSRIEDMLYSFYSIEEELRSQYVISYKPADFVADGRFRSIEISSLKKGLDVQTRKGYFAPNQ